MAKSKKDKTRYFIEGIIYTLAIVVVVFANCYGPICIRMIPLLFILGIVGKIIFDRPVTTTLFGVIVAICALYMSGTRQILTNLFFSVCMGLYIALGEVFGAFITKSIKLFKVKKSRKSKEAIIAYFVSLLIFIAVIFVHNVTNSNFIEYAKNKEKLITYLKTTYPNNEFQITSVSYNFLGNNSFVFTTINNIDSNSYKFIVYLKDGLDIQDGYNDYIASNEQDKLKSILQEYLEKKEINDETLKIDIIKLETGDYELEIIKKVDDIDNMQIKNFCKQVTSVINGMENIVGLDKVEQLLVSLQSNQNSSEDLTSNIYLEGYRKNKELDLEEDYRYIQRALKIEYID